jgi:Zn-dependent peptidase ImmA (M78 family)
VLRDPFPSLPFLEPSSLREAAENFLETYHPARSIPVPIEEVVEFDLGIEVRPIRRMRQRFGIDGFLSGDLSMIVVDEDLVTKFPSRYRFTLAHEVGHRELHARQIQWTQAETPEEWKRRVCEIPPRDYTRMETQANEFAGYLLVRTDALFEAYEEAAQYALDRGIELSGLSDESLTYIAEWLGKRFGVSGQVMTRRLRREGMTAGS